MPLQQDFNTTVQVLLFGYKTLQKTTELRICKKCMGLFIMCIYTRDIVSTTKYDEYLWKTMTKFLKSRGTHYYQK